MDLARAIYPALLNNGDEVYFDPFYLRHYRFETTMEDVDYSTDLTAWREDADALEIFAFSLMLYAETHVEFVGAQSRRRLLSTISDMSDALGGVKSAYAQYCGAWLKGESAIVLHPRSMRHDERYLWEVED